MHLFDEKYGDVVRIVCFGDWSCELCGGTHAQNTADVGTAVLVSESSVGAGLRRIDMVVGEAAELLIQRRLGALGELTRVLGVPPDQVVRRVEELRTQLREAERRSVKLRDELRVAQVQGAWRFRAAGGERPRPAHRPGGFGREQRGLEGLCRSLHGSPWVAAGWSPSPATAAL